MTNARSGGAGDVEPPPGAARCLLARVVALARLKLKMLPTYLMTGKRTSGKPGDEKLELTPVTYAQQQNRSGFEIGCQAAAHRAAPWPPSSRACRSLR